MNSILLVDLSEREIEQRDQLRNRKAQLDAIDKTSSSSGGLTDQQKTERDEIEAELDQDTSVDPFYRSVASIYAQKTWADLLAAAAQGAPGANYVLKHGFMGSQQRIGDGPPLAGDEQEIAGICGVLELDNNTDPTQPRFIRKVTEAQGEYRENKGLFDAAFKQLSVKFVVTLQCQIDKRMVDGSVVGYVNPGGSIQARTNADGTLNGQPDGTMPVAAVSASSVAAVVRKLAADNITANDPWLSSRIDNAFDLETGVTTGAPPSAMEIMLPDLDEDVDVEIVTQNLHAVQGLHFAYMLEEAGMWRVVEKIVDLFRQRVLPLGRGNAGDYLYKYYKTTAERMTESERRDLYMGAFGAPGGNPNASLINAEFTELWLRFVAAVSTFARQLTVEKLLRNAVPMSVSQEQVRKSGRDLASNLSLHGYGIAYFAATELQTSIREFRDLLSDPEVKSSFGARDMWQVMDQVNVNYLGGAKNTNRYRTQARAGAIIIRWLANNHGRLVGAYGTDVISVAAITNPQLRALGSPQPMVDPTDWDLVQSCEAWNAQAALGDQSIQNYSQPIESPVMTSRPIDMPAFARDALNSAGVSLPSI
jgi:hypothetical protein